MASGGSGPVQHIATRPFLEQSALEHCLRQLLDEQRHPVGLGKDPLHHLGRQRLAASHLLDDCRDLPSGHPVQRQRAQAAEISRYFRHWEVTPV